MKKILLVLLAFTLIANFTVHCVAVDANAEQTENRLLIAANNLGVSSSTIDILEKLYEYDYDLCGFICFSGLSTNRLIYLQAREFFPEFKALEKCEDAGTALLIEYIKTDISVDKKLSTFEKHKAYILAFLISQPVYWNKLTSLEMNLLVKAEIEKDKIRTQYFNDGYEKSTFMFGLELSSLQNQSADIASSYSYRSTDMLSKYSFNEVTLTTRSGASVSAAQCLDTLTTDDFNYCIERGDSFCSDRRENPTLRYNCHSYAWHSSNTTTNTYWIDYPTSYIENDPHTIEITNVNNVLEGDIIVYYNNDYSEVLHSGIVDIKDNVIMVMSKWGPCGLYYHEVGMVFPEYWAYTDSGPSIHVRFYRYRPHDYGYNAQSYNTQQHVCTCVLCGHSYYENHLWNSNNTQCMVCGFNINGSVMAIPEQAQ